MVVRVKRARVMGFCSGVRRAVKQLIAAAERYGAIETLGPAVHNESVVESLAQRGVRRIESIEAAVGKVIGIPAHGAAPEVFEDLRSRGLEVIDATCPIVRRAQRAAKELAESGYWVVIFGDALHPEVKGILGWCRGRGCAVLDLTQLESWHIDSRKIGVVSQTTQNPQHYFDFAKGVLALLAPKISKFHLENSICKEVEERQRSALELAREVEFMLVIGSRTSANTRRLAELCKPIVETALVERPEDLDPFQLQGKRLVGVTAGASTPDELIERIIDRVKALTQ